MNVPWRAWSPERKRTIRTAVGVTAGAAAGFAYYRFVGCPTGGCPISSNPWIATLWGAMLGALLGRM